MVLYCFYTSHALCWVLTYLLIHYICFWHKNISCNEIFESLNSADTIMWETTQSEIRCLSWGGSWDGSALTRQQGIMWVVEQRQQHWVNWILQCEITRGSQRSSLNQAHPPRWPLLLEQLWSMTVVKTVFYCVACVEHITVHFFIPQQLTTHWRIWLTWLMSENTDISSLLNLLSPPLALIRRPCHM